MQTRGPASETALPKVTQQGSDSAPRSGIPESLLCPLCTDVHMCVLIPPKGPRLPPTSQDVGNHFQFRRACLFHTCAFCWLFSQLEIPFLPPHCPLTLLLPGKLLLILQGPANCLLLQEASPDPQPNRVSPILLFNHKVLFNPGN